MEKLIPRLFNPPAGSFFLFGPRGTGKTTWLNEKFPDAVRVDLLEPENFRAYSAYPERLGEVIAAHPGGRVVVVDEIQRVPELLSYIHLLIERKPGIRFVLTGSSARKLRRGGTDRLAGRVARRALYPFMAAELGAGFNLGDALGTGLLPLAVSAAEPEEVLKAYVALYMREEVQAEGIVRNIGNFSRFLEAAAFSHGSVLNVSSVARECAVERKVVEGYLSVIEDLFLAFRLPVFARRAKRAVIAHSKLYFFDAGVYRSLRPRGPLDSPGGIEGSALEGIVAQHLLAWNSYRGGRNRVYFWRTAAGSEVDFVVYGSEVFWAIEVKNTTRVRPEDLRALGRFRADYPECRAFLLYRGRERLVRNGILCLPGEDFLRRLHPAETEPWGEGREKEKR